MALTRAERVLLVSGHRWGATGDEAARALGVPGARARPRRTRAAERVGRAPPRTGRSTRPRRPPDRASGPPTRSGALADVHAGAELVRAAAARRRRRATRARRRRPGRARARTPTADPGRRGRRRRPGGLGRRRRGAARRAGRRRRPPDRALPAQLSVSQLVELAADPAGLARRLRRPLPLPPNPHARRGTAFHAWLEQRFGAAQLLDLDELPGAADEGAAAATTRWRSCRRRSWPRSGPSARRSRWRCRSRPWWPGSGCAAGWTPCSPTPTAAAPWSTGRPARCPRGRGCRRWRCSSPRTGWPGRRWPDARRSGCGPRSTTCART